MKKNILIASLAVASFCSASFAATTVDLVGSTAARAAVHQEILDVLGAPGNALTSYAYSSTGGLLGSNQAIFHGTIGGTAITLRTFWSGSVNGISPVRDAGTQLNNNFYKTTILGVLAGGQVNTSGNVAAATALEEPEIGFSDVYASTAGVNACAVDVNVGVIPFKWFRSSNAPASINFLDQGKVQKLWGNLGESPLALWTGNPADEGTPVYSVGRDALSGTRLSAMMEGGYGVTSNVTQYGASLTISSGNVTLGDSGNGGSTSGGTVKTWLSTATDTTYMIGYLGFSDWLPVGQELKWNGQNYSEAAIKNGQYSFWSYLHMNSDDDLSSLAAPAGAFYTALKGGLESTPTNGLIDINTMRVVRDGDGAPVYQNY